MRKSSPAADMIVCTVAKAADNTDTSEDAVMDAARAAAKPKAATDDLETIDLDKEDK